MRKHKVECRIEERRSEDLKALQERVNFYYARNLNSILKKSNISREQKIYILEQIQQNIKK